jgi:hypothetical protein
VGLLDEDVYVFIIRIRLEPREIAGAPVKWKGEIEQIPNQNLRYLSDLRDIPAFIAGSMEGVGVKLGEHSRVRRWLNWRKPG